MNASPEATAFERGVQPVLNILISGHESELAALRPDLQMEARIEELARKSNEGDLSRDERAEYHGYVRANKFLAILQRQAQRMLKTQVGGDE